MLEYNPVLSSRDLDAIETKQMAMSLAKREQLNNANIKADMALKVMQISGIYDEDPLYHEVVAAKQTALKFLSRFLTEEVSQ